jgi:hypothetical protein
VSELAGLSPKQSQGRVQRMVSPPKSMATGTISHLQDIQILQETVIVLPFIHASLHHLHRTPDEQWVWHKMDVVSNFLVTLGRPLYFLYAATLPP